MIKNNVGLLKQYPLDDLIPSQGDLKTLSHENYLKLKSEILTEGFISPFHIWINEHGLPEILDGHQRRLTLITMRDVDKLDVPEKLPCIEVNAPDRQRASRILLALTSQYGTMTKSSFDEYLKQNNIETKEAISRFTMDAFEMVEFDLKPQKNENSEIDVDEFGKDLKNQCPSCGFEFD
jgi:hypothetical protein